MDTVHKNLTDFFQEVLTDLACQDTTRAYIIGIYGKYKNSETDLSKDNITSLFAQARVKQNFLGYQTIGDWIFWSQTYASQHLRFASKDYYDNIARSSYYSCYKLLNRQWECYHELADNFTILEEQVKQRINSLIVDL
jgi:hypothetical protein